MKNTHGLAEKILKLDGLLNKYMHKSRRPGHGHNEKGRALSLLALQPQSSVQELAYLMGMPLPAVQELVTELEELGYVIVNDGQEYLQVTAEGKAALRSDRLDDQAALFSCLEQAEREALCDYLDRLIGHVQGQLDELPGDGMDGHGDFARMADAFHGMFHGMGGFPGGRPEDGRQNGRWSRMGRGHGVYGCGRDMRDRAF